MATMFLTIEQGKLTTYDRRDDPQVLTVPEVEALMAEGGDVLCSSSIDFPEEYTDDPAVIAFCLALR